MVCVCLLIYHNYNCIVSVYVISFGDHFTSYVCIYIFFHYMFLVNMVKGGHQILAQEVKYDVKRST